MPDETVAQAEPQGDAQMNLFGDIATQYEATDAGAPPEKAELAAESSGPPPAEAPASREQQAAEAQPQAATIPPTPQQGTEQPPPQQQQYYPSTEEILQRRQAYLEQLARQYAIPEEQVDLLTTEPHKVLPQFAANVAMNTYEAITQYFNSMMPQYIAHIQQQHAVQRAGTDRFYEQWPQLRSNDPGYMKTIATVAQAYRRANPTASVEEAIDKVGRASAAMLGLTPTPRSTRTPSAKPFSHSGPGMSGGPAPAQRGGTPQDNFFADLVNGLDLSEL